MKLWWIYGNNAVYTSLIKYLVGVVIIIFLTSCTLDASLDSLRSDSVSVSFSFSSEQVTSLSSIPVEVTFSESVKGLSADNFQVENAQLVDFSGSGQSYTFNLVPQGDGVVSVSLKDYSSLVFSDTTKTIIDSSASVTVDRVAPTINISEGSPSLGNSATSYIYTVSYGEADAINLASDDISISGPGSTGCQASVSGAGNLARTVTITNCSGNGNMDFAILAGSAQDIAGNMAIAASSVAVVVDNTGPAISISAASVPTGNNTTNFQYTVTYSGATSVTLAAGDISYSGSSAGCNATVSGTGTTTRTVSITGCTGDGSLGFSIAAGTASDAVGNSADSASSPTVVINNSGPTISISAASVSTGNRTTNFQYTVTYSGATSVTLAAGDISYTGASVGCNASVSGTGSTTRTVSITGCTGDGSLGFTIAAATASDDATNSVGSASSTTVLIDNTSPIISISAPSVATGNSTTNFQYTVTYSGATSVTLAAGDISYTGASVGCNATVSGTGTTTRTVSITGCTGDGSLGFTIAAGTASDDATNSAGSASSTTVLVDNTSPTISISASSVATGNSTTNFQYTVTYSGATSVTLVVGDISYTGASAGCNATVSGTGTTTRTVSITGCTGDGSLGFTIAAGTASDDAGNTAIATSSVTVVINNSGPTISISAPSVSTGNSTTNFQYTVTYSGATSVTLAVGDISYTGVSAGCNATVSGTGTTTRTVSITGCTGDGSLGFTIAAGTATDDATNSTGAASSATVLVDNTNPTISISAPSVSTGNSTASFEYTVTYSGATSVPLAAGDISYTGASAGCHATVSGTGTTTRTVSITGCTGDGSLGFTIAAGTATDDATNSTGAASSATVLVDNTNPTISISAPSVSTGNSTTSFEYTVTYSGATSVTLAAGDISYTGASVGCNATVNGTGTTTRTVSITGCSGDGSLGFTIAAGTASDDAGNSAASASSASFVVDNTSPTIAISAASVGLGNSSTSFEYTVTYGGASSVTLAAGDISYTGASAGCNATVSGTGTTTRTVSITGCTGDGILGFTIAAGTANDDVGNTSEAAFSGAVVVDNTNPTISISAPSVATGNSATTFEYTVTYSGATSVTLATGDISYVGDSAGCNATVAGTGSTTRTVAITGCTGDGVLSFSIAAGTASDDVGNTASAASSLSVVVDNTSPTISISVPSVSTGNSSTSFEYTVTYSGATSVTLVAGDISYTGAIAGCNATVSGTGTTTRTVAITGCTGDGSLGFTIAAGTASDDVGNNAASASSTTVLVDNTNPTISISSPSVASGNSTTTFEYTVTYSGATSVALATGDISYTGVSAGCSATVSGTGTTTRTVSITGCIGDGSLSFTIAAGTASDDAGNMAVAASSVTVVIDNTGPTIAISAPSVSTGNSTTNFEYIVTYNVATSVTLAVGDISYTGASAGCNATVSGTGTTTRTVAITGCTGDGSLGFTIAAGTASDDVGNNAASASSTTVLVDNTNPTISISSPSVTSGNSTTTFEYTVTYSGATSVTLATGDISYTGVSAGCSATVSGTGTTTRTVAITGCTGDGSLGFTIAAGTASDDVGNTAIAASSIAVVVDNISPTISVSAASASIGNSTTNFQYTVTYTGATVVTLATGDISFTGASAGCNASVSGTGTTTRTVSITGCTGDGSLGFTIAAGTASDDAGNLSASGSTIGAVTLDNTPPTLSIGNPFPGDGNISTNFVWTLTYSGATSVTLSATDITLNGASTGCYVDVSGTGTTTRTVSVTGCFDLLGALSLTVGPSAQDDAGNQNVSVGPSASVTVKNPITVSLASSFDAVNEGNSTNTQSFTVSLSTAATQDMTVNYEVSPYYTTAVNPTNYNLPSTGSIVIPAGNTSGTIDYSYFGNLTNGGSKIIQVILKDIEVSGAVTNIDKQQTRRLVLDEEAGETVGVSFGYSHTCAVTSLGVLKCWGNNTNGQLGDGTTTNKESPVWIDSGVSYSSVAAGGVHTCAITGSGVLKCWGANPYGQVGDGTTTDRLSPVVIDSGVSYSSVDVGRNHTCGITTAGILKCWGLNGSGRIGDGTTVNRLSPVVIDSGVSYSSVNLDRNTCGITIAGVLKCWGLNDYGQLGDGTTTDRLSPVVINSGVSYSSITPGEIHTCGITTAGVLKCWGGNIYGQLGDGTTTATVNPKVIDSGVTYSEISAGYSYTCGITSAGALKCWGANGGGQLGDGTTTQRTSPVDIDSGVNYNTIIAGNTYSCGITSLGILKCWGVNGYGQLGDGTITRISSPLVVDSGVTYSSLDAGNGHNCGITSAGVLRCWGFNTNGQLGDSTTTHKTRPVIIDSGVSYNGITTGNGHTCGITSTGVLKCWGSNSYGQLGDGTTTDKVSPVAIDGGMSYGSVDVGTGHACAITSTGVLKCWGLNTYGQLGDGTTTDKTSPVVINSGVNYNSVSTGYAHTCGITSAGALKCWGSNSYGQLGDGTTTDKTSPVVIDSGVNYNSVSTGYAHACGITSAGVLKCWGANANAQLGEGTIIDKVSPVVIDSGVSYSNIETGSFYTCGTTTVGVLKCWGANGFGAIGIGAPDYIRPMITIQP